MERRSGFSIYDDRIDDKLIDGYVVILEAHETVTSKQMVITNLKWGPFNDSIDLLVSSN